FTVAQALDMAALETLLEGVDDLLKRLDRARERYRAVDIALDRQIERLADRSAHGAQLLRSRRGERQLRLPELVHAPEDILRIVADLLKVGKRVHHLRGLAALVHRADVVDVGQ